MKFYFTGKPCSRGHISYRRVDNRNCSSCVGKGSEAHNKKLEKRREKNAEKKKLKQEQFLASLPFEIREKLVSKKEAKEKGLKRYFTGIACVNGHIAEREMDGACVTCRRIKNKARRATPEAKAKAREKAKKRWADLEKRAQSYEARKKWVKENPERIKELRKKGFYKHHEKNLATRKAYAKKI